MIQLFKYLKDAGWTVGLIVLLLIVQAWCDLSLPTYTSDIVDVGIQQGGIAYAVPYRMRGETLREVFARKGYNLQPQRIQGIKEYIELHIEQGKVLEDHGASIGVVSAMAAG